ncbi:hypothetical protein HYE54_12010 [Aggregatibacter actinomycetemcomitans]|uniref:hypothetical protein n=1 Tax=Aggregatibacter actinomycetemcomitans TaxID=714 RepID=UPI00197C9538|nr:hypothetical protein [Aggregatibacter actinomycetemcomitans]MBN6069424.1 hypothetical protein [Aggregatibacter actinomycetemcomitans]MBN6087086.1 hypothetical protein [Aggregatibacter actinomycetemcomitans]
MKKRLLVAFIGAVLLSGCASKNPDPSTYSKWNAIFEKEKSTEIFSSKYKLFMKEEIPFTTEDKVNGDLTLKALEDTFKTLDNRGNYVSIIEESRKKQKQIYAGKRYSESYIHVISKGNYPESTIYQRIMIDYGKGESPIISDGVFTRIKFDCLKSGNDSITLELSRVDVPTKLGRAPAIAVSIKRLNISGGEKGILRYYLRNGEYAVQEFYFSKEDANKRSSVIDKAKQISCGF